jgi:hypothetical protein
MQHPVMAVAVGVALSVPSIAALAAEPARAATPAPPVPATPAAVTTPDPAARALLGGKASLSLRARWEGVTDDAVPRDASALTLRTRLGWQSAPLGGFGLSLEFDDVRALVDDYNSTNGGDPRRAVVADPEGTEVNVAAVTWADGAHSGALGRQRVTFDNHRFVGNVGWRQNEQTYDGASFRTKAVPRTELAYAYVQNVNRVFGPRDGGSQPANWHGGSHLLNAKVAAGPAGTVSLFAYAMEFDNAEAQSNATYGALWTGAVPLDADFKLPFALSYATQEDYGDNPVAYSADYWQAEAGLTWRAVTVKLGRETLGGDASRPGRMFRTPLATLHAFQGWADKFLTTPPQGVEDTYVGVTGKVAGVDLQAFWHDYGAEAVSRDYGTELNLSASYKFAKRYEVLAKFADYRADGFARDTRKYWLQFGASF